MHRGIRLKDYRGPSRGHQLLSQRKVHTADALPSLARQMKSPECSNPWQNEKHLDVADTSSDETKNIEKLQYSAM